MMSLNGVVLREQEGSKVNRFMLTRLPTASTILRERECVRGGGGGGGGERE